MSIKDHLPPFDYLISIQGPNNYWMFTDVTDASKMKIDQDTLGTTIDVSFYGLCDYCVSEYPQKRSFSGVEVISSWREYRFLPSDRIVKQVYDLAQKRKLYVLGVN